MNNTRACTDASCDTSVEYDGASLSFATTNNKIADLIDF